MRYYTILAVFAVSAFAFTSCIKSYRCSCYSPDLNHSTPSFEIKDTKKNAQDECESQPQSGLYTGTDYICHLEY